MDEVKQARLEAKGWKVGTVTEFLDLTPEEAALIEIKLALSKSLRERREKRMTQVELAERMHSSQPRIAKAEGGDRSVSLDLLMRAMLATGATPSEIGRPSPALRRSYKPAASDMDRLPPIHPGEVLLKDFMKPLGLTQYRVAKDIGVSPLRIIRLSRATCDFCGYGSALGPVFWHQPSRVAAFAGTL